MSKILLKKIKIKIQTLVIVAFIAFIILLSIVYAIFEKLREVIIGNIIGSLIFSTFVGLFLFLLEKSISKRNKKEKAKIFFYNELFEDLQELFSRDLPILNNEGMKKTYFDGGIRANYLFDLLNDNKKEMKEKILIHFNYFGDSERKIVDTLLEINSTVKKGHVFGEKLDNFFIEKGASIQNQSAINLASLKKTILSVNKNKEININKKEEKIKDLSLWQFFENRIKGKDFEKIISEINKYRKQLYMKELELQKSLSQCIKDNPFMPKYQ